MPRIRMSISHTSLLEVFEHLLDQYTGLRIQIHRKGVLQIFAGEVTLPGRKEQDGPAGIGLRNIWLKFD